MVPLYSDWIWKRSVELWPEAPVSEISNTILLVIGDKYLRLPRRSRISNYKNKEDMKHGMHGWLSPVPVLVSKLVGMCIGTLCRPRTHRTPQQPLSCISSWFPCLEAKSQPKYFRQHQYHSFYHLLRVAQLFQTHSVKQFRLSKWKVHYFFLFL